MDTPPGPLEEPTGEWFVNRKEELDLFWQWATGIPHPGRRSYALIGLRRTGKTAILHKVFNRLFYEQTAVVPVYISFARYLNRPQPIDAYEFAAEYFTGLLRSYLAFRHRQPALLQHQADFKELQQVAQQVADDLALTWFERYEGAKSVSAHNLMQWVINLPKGYAWTHNLPMALMVDEFQVLTNVYNPDNELPRNLTDSFQQAAETKWAPMLVSGSSISMLMGDALGGMLSGRFRPYHLGPLAQEHALDMVFRLGKVNGIAVTEELALAIWGLTQGYPYPIECLLNSDSPAVTRLPDLESLNEVVLYELTQRRGALWEHYESEYGKYIRQLNGDQIARKVLFWVTNHPDQPIFAEQVAETLALDRLQVQEALEKLYKTDVIQRASISSFSGPTDPLMREFLKYEHYIDIENLTATDAVARVQQQLHAQQGEMNRQTGHFTEIIVAGVLHNYDDRTVEGEAYFSVSTPVALPRMATIERREGTLKTGKVHEVDVIGEYKLYNGAEGNGGLGTWLVSVRYRTRKLNASDVDAFIRHTDAMQAEKGYGQVTRWYFSKAGFTEGAVEKLKEAGIYFSDLQQFNALSSLFGLLPLTM